MDVAGISVAMNQAKTIHESGVAMLSKTMDTNEKLGEGLVKMMNAAQMERSVNPSVGANLDIRL